MPDHDAWIRALRHSHERCTALVQPLDAEAVQRPSYDDGWSIAQVASHLGSQAEIFAMFLDAGLSGRDAPGSEQFAPIWDEWNAKEPAQQVADSIDANAAFVARIEALSDSERDGFALSMFGTQFDLPGFAAMRLAEHAVHTWDIAVALDPGAVLSADAVELLVDVLPATAARAGKATEDARTVAIETVAPRRDFVLTTGPALELAARRGNGPAELRLPAEALVRLVYGRLDAEHAPPGVADDGVLASVRLLFPGF